MSDRLIKKYPNRRLYDTQTSSYITLTDVKQLVLDNEEFVARDAKKDDHLTRSILLQIILEEEFNGTPMFSSADYSLLWTCYARHDGQLHRAEQRFAYPDARADAAPDKNMFGTFPFAPPPVR